MYYIYILKSEQDQSKYIGVTSDLKRRFLEHNQGSGTYTKSKRPYKIIWYCVFKDKVKAYSFERYLKSSSVYAFMKKRFI